ncbi:MAG TPA: YlxR family protein [Bacillota bacterium]|nr:YlxR family protein [Bacillota bacterium]
MTKNKPERKCVGCNEMKEKSSLIRIVRQDERVFVDTTGKANGRGAYVCKSCDCIKKAVKQNRFEKALGVKLTEQICEQLTALTGESE